MDRDKRWERVKVAYDLLVNGEGKVASDMVQAMQESYDEGVTDEFIKPIVNANFDGTIKEGDVVIFFNYRNDRAKELTIVLTQQDMPKVFCTFSLSKRMCTPLKEASYGVMQ